MLAPVALALTLAFAPPNDRLSPDSMMVELRKGGYTILWRHAATDYSTRRDSPMTARSSATSPSRALSTLGSSARSSSDAESLSATCG